MKLEKSNILLNVFVLNSESDLTYDKTLEILRADAESINLVVSDDPVCIKKIHALADYPYKIIRKEQLLSLIQKKGVDRVQITKKEIDKADLTDVPKVMSRDDSSQPKVLVAAPTFEGKEYALSRYKQVIEGLDYGNYDVLLVDNTNDPSHTYMKKVQEYGIPCNHVVRGGSSREAIVRSQNRIRDVLLSGDYDYLMFIEQDIFPPADVIQSLMEHNKASVNALYWHGSFEKRHPFIMEERNNKNVLALNAFEMAKSKKLYRVHDPGFGCSLIKRSVLESIMFRYNEDDMKHGDRYFYLDMEEYGFEVYLDTSVMCEHWNRPWIKSVVPDR